MEGSRRKWRRGVRSRYDQSILCTCTDFSKDKLKGFVKIPVYKSDLGVSQNLWSGAGVLIY